LKILILKPSSLGDVVQALPVLRLLKQHYWDSETYWWIETANEPLLEDDPDLAGIFRFDRERWATPWHWDDIWKAIHELRRHKFDLIIDLQALARSATVGWLAGGKCFIGLHDWRELASGYYDINVPRPSPNTHAVDWYLEVLKVLGVRVHWDFEWLPRREHVAREVEALWQLNGAPTVALLPGARWENKRWPAQHFRELVDELRARHGGLRFVILGGKADSALGHAISSAKPQACLDLTGRTSLPQMIEVLRKCSVVVTNDTGPMHIAAAMRKPVVGIFGPTNPARTGPYGQVQHALQRHNLPCVPCMKSVCTYHEPIACLRGISAQQVAQEVFVHLGSADSNLVGTTQ
jgi:lipopolysaccharide heptosyltransferase I